MIGWNGAWAQTSASGASKGKAQGALGSCRSGGNGTDVGLLITLAVRAAKVTIR